MMRRIPTPTERPRIASVFGLGADSVGEIDDSRNEIRDRQVRVELRLERRHQTRRQHCTEQPDKQPRQPVPQPPSHVFEAGGARRFDRVQEPAQARQVLIVLLHQNGEQLLRRDQTAEPALLVDHGQARFTMVHRL